MSGLEVILRSQGIDFSAKDRQIMCFAHIINICVQDIITKCTKGDSDSSVKSLLGRAREVVRHARASGARRDSLVEVIKSGNLKGWFMVNGKHTTVENKQLLRDVRTRWSSTYQMLERIYEMRLVCCTVPEFFRDLTLF